jgi:hypothetical protein
MNPPTSNEPAPEENTGLEQLQEPRKDTEKIRGFLILVAIFLIFNLLRNLAIFYGSIAPIIRSPLWERYTNPASPRYHPQWKLVIICDAISATITLFLTIVIAALFFRKKKVFPVLMAASIPIFFLLDLGGHFLGGLIPGIAESAVYAKAGTALITKFIGMHIWIPYFLLSKRVAKTFVR